MYVAVVCKNRFIAIDLMSRIINELKIDCAAVSNMNDTIGRRFDAAVIQNRLWDYEFMKTIVSVHDRTPADRILSVTDMHREDERIINWLRKLKEIQDKNKAKEDECKYCGWEEEDIYNNREKMSTKRDFYPGIEVCMSDGDLYVLAVADTYEPGVTEAYIKINYCPMCGRKIRKESEE